MREGQDMKGISKEPLLEVKNLSLGIKKGRNILSAVDNISFTVETREIVGIVGESGCGKSLTALSIPMLLPQGAERIGGSIRFNGLELSGLSPKEIQHIRGKDLSMVFQEPQSSLNPLIKIGAQIAEPLELHGENDRALNRKRVIDLMDSLGLSDPEKLLAVYPHQLSGGMCQRVMIALAVVCKPKLLIADEPTTALDVTIQAQILELLKKINTTLGASILFISHDLSVISRLCDRVLVMYAGKLVETGMVKDVFTHPAHEYTRGLLGSIPGRDRKGKPLASIPGKVPSLEEGRPAGCPFNPRCGKAQEYCLTEQCGSSFPVETDLGGGHKVHCVLAENSHGN
ncbi:ABC transporter ATP-binding protein [Spirochaetia bacterium]|nr:ABC transporter ATP-binding protein [Spirochaetia bacterium]